MDPINTLKSGMSPVQRAGSQEDKQENIAAEFEKIFARQMISQMTKGIFESDNSGVLNSGNSLYSEQVTDILAEAFADQEPLKIADMVRSYWNQKNIDGPEFKQEHPNTNHNESTDEQ